MKRLKNYFRSVKEIEEKEKRIDKEIKRDARDKTAIKSFVVFLPVYLIIINLFIFIEHFLVLMLILNIFIIAHIYLYQYTFYGYLELNKHRVSIIKTIIYGLTMTIIVWILAYITGGFLWN